MSKRKLTITNVAKELAEQRLAADKKYNDLAYSGEERPGEAKHFTKTLEDYFPDAIDFVLRCRKAQW